MAQISFHIQLADIPVAINCLSPSMRDFCRDYITDAPARISVSVTQDDIDAEAAAKTSKKNNVPCETASVPMHESAAIQRKIAEIFPLHNRFLMHGAAITYQDNAYLFCAPSGTGKSTHISLWRQYLGDAVGIINGDKPFLSLEEEGNAPYLRVHGSPWAGKEHWQKNRSAPLRAICLMRQDSQNSITRLEPDQCIPQIMRQVYIPRDPKTANETLRLIDQLINLVPIYQLRCNISEEAVRCSFEAMTGNTYPQMKINR